ncbi:type III pantothenate kinase [Kozakia baliensis]|uniref:Type III pantothenate kinase n=1 Tax=Kozakia baliensis TaxID=153496 RepID=A0A1D8UTV2_9PROT|nr:type III pantothenate kinase [Kozakia baliensis]AOX17080.1 type III pantothenate kinase [Kozakia baliensis]AOX19677.1 type III pantothenate kinase [Kozakia baliensis]GBR24944.1 pantothenate kinase [Kozakia baliensis NRIC 0488]GEL63855.1 type III pantothenate kinase [Kozakia baliensis]
MLLVVDAGNTNIVFAVHDGASWQGTWRISTNDQRTSDEYAAWLLLLLERSQIDPKKISRAIIGTVVPAALYHLRRLCRQWLAIEPLIANAALDWGYPVHVDTPEEVGVDRRLNGLAAQHLFGGPLIVVDFGTATTFDVVDAQGAYCGGAIAPGVNLSLEALHQAAARLPRISVGRPSAAIGRSTTVAMRSGLFWGYVGLVEGIVSRIALEMGPPVKVIATGGLAPLFSEGTELFQHVAPKLTLDGLRLLAARNTSYSAIPAPG